MMATKTVRSLSLDNDLAIWVDAQDTNFSRYMNSFLRDLKEKRESAKVDCPVCKIQYNANYPCCPNYNCPSNAQTRCRVCNSISLVPSSNSDFLECQKCGKLTKKEVIA